MRTILLFLLFPALHPLVFSQSITRDSLINLDWKFQKGDVDGAESHDFDDSGWRTIDLPHDWSIEDLDAAGSGKDAAGNSPFDPDAIGGMNSGYTTGGTAWYRKSFRLPLSDTGKIAYLIFDGVYMNSDVWINGHRITNQPYGYSPFRIDISGHLNYGDTENSIAVQVKNEGDNSRWYAGSGIYRDVTLSVVNKIHVKPWGVFISTPGITEEQSLVSVTANVVNRNYDKKDIEFRAEVLDPDNNSVSLRTISTRLHEDHTSKLKINLIVDKPEFWSPKTPKLYKLKCSIKLNDEIVDTYESHFGIRSIEFDPEKGMSLNGKNIKLKGGAVHANNGLLGAAAWDDAEERRVRILKEAGFNAVRCAHNPPSSSFLDACDRLGLLVIDEAFDTWVSAKVPDDYNKYFEKNWKHDLTNMILRDRNHPSIFTWSIGNQIRTARNKTGIGLAHELADYTRHLDPTRPVTANVFMHIRGNMFNGSPDLWKSYDAFFEALDLAGYSYQSVQYPTDHARVPDRIMFSSEIEPRNCFANWMRAMDNDWVIGNFTWTAMDYTGEAASGWYGYPFPPSVYPWHSTNCGDIDLCGFRKPRSYYRDILFQNGKQISLFAHAPVPSFEGDNTSRWGWDDVKPCWTWPGFEEEPLKVDVYSGHEQVELFLNERSLGMQSCSRETEFKAGWEVPYEPGILKAVAYQNGLAADSSILRTTGQAHAIELHAEKELIRPNRRDLCFIVVKIVDKNGHVVPDADNLVNFEVKGEGELLAVGNGDPTSLESFRQPFRKAYEGKCLLVVRSTDRTGTVTVTASSKGLKKNTIRFESIHAAARIPVNNKQP